MAFRRGAFSYALLATVALWFSGPAPPVFVGSQPTTILSRDASRVSMAGKKEWVGPKKGSWVRILRPDSYWYQEKGLVVNVAQFPNVKYPVSIKFEMMNYANVNVNSFALWEVEDAPAPVDDWGSRGR